MLRRSLVLSAALASSLAPLAPLSASAEVDAATATVVAPVTGAALSQGSRPPVTVALAAAPAGTYALTLDCEGDGDGSDADSYLWWTHAVSHDGSPAATYTVAGPALTAVGTCYLTIDTTTDYRTLASALFTVTAQPAGVEPGGDPGSVPEPVAVDVVGVQPATLYPVLRDGYRDTTKVVYVVNLAAKVTTTVTNRRTGRVVARAGSDVAAGRRTWTWNGKIGGRPAPAGGYRVAVRVVATDGSTDQDAAAVTAKARRGR